MDLESDSPRGVRFNAPLPSRSFVTGASNCSPFLEAG
jgi:hypothetical protein